MNPHGIGDDELLSALGPSWSAMTPAQRKAYGPADEPVPASTTLEAIADLITLAMAHPAGIRSEGLVSTAWRWGEPGNVIALALLLEGEANVNAPVLLEEETPVTPLRPAVRPSPTRESMADKIARELRRGRSA